LNTMLELVKNGHREIIHCLRDSLGRNNAARELAKVEEILKMKVEVVGMNDWKIKMQKLEIGRAKANEMFYM
jgi:hypothetical protein